MTETLSVPLNELSVWTGNVRKTGAGEGIGELAASIEAHGLLQALIVRKAKDGKYAVVAGQRRLKALQLLAAQDRLPGDAPVRCELVAADTDGGELSLAENVVRVAMHPADQFEAFRDLVDRGLDVAAIARRFGVADTVVAKRLAALALLVHQHIGHAAFDNRQQDLAAQLFERVAVGRVAFRVAGRIGQPADHYAVTRDREIVVDADHVAIGIAQLDNELVIVAGEPVRCRAVDVQVPLPPLRAPRPFASGHAVSPDCCFRRRRQGPQEVRIVLCGGRISCLIQPR